MALNTFTTSLHQLQNHLITEEKQVQECTIIKKIFLCSDQIWHSVIPIPIAADINMQTITYYEKRWSEKHINNFSRHIFQPHLFFVALPHVVNVKLALPRIQVLGEFTALHSSLCKVARKNCTSWLARCFPYVRGKAYQDLALYGSDW